MFTEEEKIRAIKLYFKYGKKLAPVVRELGYPSKRNLRRWIRSWEAGGGIKESIRHKHRYSDKQKQVAVEHYLNHGCCLAFTSRALGYPCTDVLARWVNELYSDRRRIFISKANPVAPFEPAVKRQAVMALCTRQVSASEMARRIGVSRAVLYKWKDEIIGNSAYQTMRKHNEPSLEAERDALWEEVARLNQEIRRRQMELDILKKAEEIIKKDPGISISHLNNREKTKIADALRQTYTLTSLFRILCKCLFSEVTVQAVTELDNKAAHCHSPVLQRLHFWDADWIASHTTFFTESSVGNTLRFLIAWRITLFSDSMAFVV